MITCRICSDHKTAEGWFIFACSGTLAGSSERWTARFKSIYLRTDIGIQLTFPKVSFNLHIQLRIYFIFSRQLMDPCILITKFQNYLVRESYENSSVGQGVCLIIITMKFYYEKYQKKTKLYVIFKSKSSFRISK